MSSEEVPITHRIEEPPSLQVVKLREVKLRHLGYRFVAGALTSIAAGGLALLFGARLGGLMLAFPAILAASLTLIEYQEDSVEARESARGAVVGGLALAVFAAVATLTLGALAGALALLLATFGWFIAAAVGYAAAWWGPASHPRAGADGRPRAARQRGGRQAQQLTPGGRSGSPG